MPTQSIPLNCPACGCGRIEFRRGRPPRCMNYHCGRDIPVGPIEPTEAESLWLEFARPYELCGLCGNTGWVDTRPTAVSPAGVRCGVRLPCICPDGRQVLREQSGPKPKKGVKP